MVLSRRGVAFARGVCATPSRESGSSRGSHHEGVRQYFRKWLESFETHEICAQRFIDVSYRLSLSSLSLAGSRPGACRRIKTSEAKAPLGRHGFDYSLEVPKLIKAAHFKIASAAIKKEAVIQLVRGLPT